MRVGLPNAGNANLQTIQEVRQGGPTVTATITNSNPAVAELETTAVTGQSVTVQIALGLGNSPTTVAAGGVVFDPLAPGSTQVTGAIPGFITTTAGSVHVTVSP